MSIRDRAQAFYLQFLSLKGEPGAIARASALGVFIGITPTIPFHTAMIMAICFAFRQNITAAMLSATVVSNPLTIPVLYLAQYELGRWLLGMEGNPFALESYDIRAILELGWHILYPLLLGGCLLAVAGAIPAYFLVRHTFRKLRGRNVQPAEPAP